MNSRLSRIKSQSREAVKNGAKIIFLTNENLKQGYLPIPMPLVVSAVHHALVKNKLRSAVSLICLSGDVVEDHHVAVLIGLGASAVYPFMAYELIREHFHDDKDWPNKMANYRYALEKGILKIMSKMGISTISSYHGGMLFHTLGLDKDLIGKYFPSFRSELGGIGLNHIKQNLMQQHSAAFLESSPSFSEKGYFRFRKNGESHGYSLCYDQEGDSYYEYTNLGDFLDPNWVYTKDDNWTVCTQDGNISAHFEHSIAITDKGTKILTI